MRILFAIGTAVSALLLTSCTNPDTSGGVTMQKADVGDGHPSNWPFPDGSCSDQHSFAKTNTGCGWVTKQDVSPELSYFIAPGVNLAGENLATASLDSANLKNANFQNSYLYETDFTNADLSGADFSGAEILDNVIFNGAILDCINHPICN